MFKYLTHISREIVQRSPPQVQLAVVDGSQYAVLAKCVKLAYEAISSSVRTVTLWAASLS